MNLKTLRRLARWADKIAVALAQLSKEMSEELTKAETSQDPLGRHIYRARASYRITSQGDNSKTGKRTALSLQTSFFEARELGFRGSFDDWDSLMKSGKLTTASASE